MRATQQSTGVLQIDSQARSLIESAAILRGQVVAKQVQIQSMRSFAAEDNPHLVLAKQETGCAPSATRSVGRFPAGPRLRHYSFEGQSHWIGCGIHAPVRDLKYHETVFDCSRSSLRLPKLDEAREGSLFKWWILLSRLTNVIPAPSSDRCLGYDSAFFLAASSSCCGKAWPEPSSCQRAGSGWIRSRSIGTGSKRRYDRTVVGVAESTPVAPSAFISQVFQSRAEHCLRDHHGACLQRY